MFSPEHTYVVTQFIDGQRTPGPGIPTVTYHHARRLVGHMRAHDIEHYGTVPAHIEYRIDPIG
ncbi:hypothetical protein [Nocardia acidivorans]|uniref:hypothetical protein n=1 Tax=Nocardia acidivorans TaxID=404580 RepID=UPI000837A07D|nr:hypothetical protein [Nocardia acidivorans]